MSETANPKPLPTYEAVSDAVTDLMHGLGYFAPVGPTASDESDDRARRDAIAAMVADALPARVLSVILEKYRG